MLIVIQIFKISIQHKHLSGQFQHIIGITSLSRSIIQTLTLLTRYAETFIATISSDSQRVIIYNHIPEVTGSFMINFIRGKFIFPGYSHKFRYLIIGMASK